MRHRYKFDLLCHNIQSVDVECLFDHFGQRYLLSPQDVFLFNKPKDPIIAENTNTYRFADYKEQVIYLLTRICTLSVVTMKVVG